ncbi:MAG: GNAT family N-acetyltransferase [Acetobacteraceae bacterium]|nr:GNAT family N-acetyltransferase [Acetobacteraceae bacterium]
MIRAMAPDDIPQVQSIALAVNKGEAYDLRSFLGACLAQKPDLCLVAEDGGETVGVAIGGQVGTLGMVDLLAVAPSRQGTGIGNQLMDELSRRCRERGVKRLVVLVSSASSGFYRALGFEADEDLKFMSKRI